MSDDADQSIQDSPLSDQSSAESQDTDTHDSRDRQSTFKETSVDDVKQLADINIKLAERRLKLDELRFKLEERRIDHDMMIEVRREDFREQEFGRDRDMLTGANEHWMKSYWRPAAGWVYLIICISDFVIFPLLSMIIPVVAKGFGVDIAYTPWVSITLTQGGLIHLSFGAILGVSAWTRGKEKLAVMSKN